MKCVITVNMDNASFEEPSEEIARILRGLAHRIETDQQCESRKIYDLNGNAVGTIKFTGKKVSP